jgi:hypothetical protein
VQTFHVTAKTSAQARRHLQGLEHYADRREQLIDGLDLDALGPNQLYQLIEGHEALEEAFFWGRLHLEHLSRMDALAAELATPNRLAA